MYIFFVCVKNYLTYSGKILGDNATEQEIEDFLAESAIMLDFHHPNVMKLVGVCFDTDNKQPLIILPYMANGDLKSFLRSKRINDTTNNDKEHYPTVNA